MLVHITLKQLNRTKPVVITTSLSSYCSVCSSLLLIFMCQKTKTKAKSKTKKPWTIQNTDRKMIWTSDLEECQRALYSNMKLSSVTQWIGVLHIKTSVTHYFLFSITLTKMKKNATIQNWQSCGKIHILMYFLRVCEFVCHLSVGVS